MSKNRNILSNIFNEKAFDRSAFQHFAKRTCGIEASVADEIFSCATNAFGDELNLNELPDLDMSKSQFVAGIVRLANLWTLMNEGMQDCSQLARQTQSFLAQI